MNVWIRKVWLWIFSVRGTCASLECKWQQGHSVDVEQHLVWLLGLPRFVRILICCRRKWHYNSCAHSLGIKAPYLLGDSHVFLGPASHPAPTFGTAVLQWFYSDLSNNFVPWWSLGRNFTPGDSSSHQLWLQSFAFCSWWNTFECCCTALAYLAVYPIKNTQVMLCSSSLLHFIPVQIIPLFGFFPLLSFFCHIR